MSLMAKKSNRRRLRLEKDNMGCVWGFIGIFDFRQHPSAQKLLQDKKHGSARQTGSGGSKTETNLLTGSREKHGDYDNSDGIGTQAASGFANVKASMDEEMSKACKHRKTPGNEVEMIQPYLGIGIHTEESAEKPGKKAKAVAKLPPIDIRDTSSTGVYQSKFPNASEITTLDFNLATFMIEFYTKAHLSQEEHADCRTETRKAGFQSKHECSDELDSELLAKHSILCKALGDVADVFLSSKLSRMDSIAVNRELIQSKEFMHALEVLSSNKDLLVRLLQDPNSFVSRHMCELKKALSRKSSELSGEEGASIKEPQDSMTNKAVQKQEDYGPFNHKKMQLETKQQEKCYQSVNRIVVLKPSPNRSHIPSDSATLSSSPQPDFSLKGKEQGERARSHFSFKEIKRHLRHAIVESKKDWHFLSMDSVLHRIPYGSKDQGNICKSSGEASQSSSISERKSTKSKTKRSSNNGERGANSSKPGDQQRESLLYEEAKRHLAERLDGNLKETSHRRLSTKSLAKIIALPDYNFLTPQVSPGRASLSPSDIVFSPTMQGKLENAAHLSDPLRQNIERPLLVDENSDDSQQLGYSRSIVPQAEEQDANSEKGSTMEGCSSIKYIASMVHPEEHNSVCAPLDSIHHEDSGMSDNCSEEEDSITASRVITTLEESQPMTPCASTSESKLRLHDEDVPQVIMEESQPMTLFTFSNQSSLSLHDEQQNIMEESQLINRSVTTSTCSSLVDDLETTEKEESRPMTPCVSTSPCFLPLHDIETTENKGESQPMTPYVSTSPCSLLVHDVALVNIVEMSGRPSPISVLEPVFSEDSAISKRTSVKQDELPVQPRQLSFKEAKSSIIVETSPLLGMLEKESILEYVRIILDLSDLTGHELSERCHSDQVLDLSLFDEAAVSCDTFQEDSKLLFDCINEILVDVKKKYFVGSPWMPHIRQVPKRDGIIREVCKVIQQHLQRQFPSTLEQIVQKDMHGGNWMDLQVDFESTIVQLGGDILDYIMEEIILELWD